MARLEGGEVGLEEAVALFEQGQGYLAACRERLAAAQKRIEELTADELGPAPADAAGQRSPTRRSERRRGASQRSRRFRSRSIRLSGTWQPALADVGVGEQAVLVGAQGHPLGEHVVALRAAAASSPPRRSGNWTQYSRTGAIERGSSATTGRCG